MMEVAKHSVEPESKSFDHSPRTRFKASDLPLTQVQRTSIDGILHTFKKKGEFDILRKKLYAQFEESDAKNNLLISLTSLAESELERNPSLLGKDRRQAAPLVEGAAERSEIYKTAEADIDRIISHFVADAEEKLREIRRADIGHANAAEEQKRGSKSDEEYARESAVRRQAWEKTRQQELEIQRKREIEDQRRQEEERQRMQVEEDERERERAIEREREKKRQEEWQRELEERRERKKRQDAEWERERLEKEEQARKKREAEREKEIEAAALEELLREGKRLAAKSGRAEDVPTRDGGSKESALAAIMKAEKLERERAAKAEEDVGNTAEGAKDGGPKDETLATDHAENDLAAQDRSMTAGYLYKSNVWVRDGQVPKQAPYKRGTFGPPESRPEPTKPPEGLTRKDTSHREDVQRNSPRYRDEHGSNHHFDGSYERTKEGIGREAHRPSFDVALGRPSTKDRTTETIQKAPRDYDRSDRSSDECRKSRSPSKFRAGNRHEDVRETERRETERRSRAQGSSRSRSPSRHHRMSYRDRDREKSSARSVSRPRRRSRSRDPKDIDRYVPSSLNRSQDHDRDRERDRHARERGREGEAGGSKNYDRSREYHRERERDRSTERDRDRDRDFRSNTGRRSGRDYRSKDAQDERDRERDGDMSHPPVQIDRYMPSTSYRAKRGELEGPAIARTHALAGSQKDRKRSRSRSKSPNRSTRHEVEKHREPK